MSAGTTVAQANSRRGESCELHQTRWRGAVAPVLDQSQEMMHVLVVGCNVVQASRGSRVAFSAFEDDVSAALQMGGGMPIAPPAF